MKREYLEQEIKEALYGRSLRYSVPEDEQTRIEEKIRMAATDRKKEEKIMKMRQVKKAVVLAAAAVALVGTVCMAAGKIKYTYSSSSPADAVTDFSGLEKLEKEAGVETRAVEAFSNGYAFEAMNLVNGEDVDENGNTVQKFKEISIDYEKDGKQISYDVMKRLSDLSEGATQTLEADGQTYYYDEMNNKFVPEGYELTEEDLAAQEAGTLNLAYGSSEVEEKVSNSLYWQKDGVTYCLFGFDTGLTAEDFLQMALELQ